MDGTVALARALALDVRELAAPKVSTEIAEIDAELTRLHAAYDAAAERSRDDVDLESEEDDSNALDVEYQQLLARLGEHPAQSLADTVVKAKWLGVE